MGSGCSTGKKCLDIEQIALHGVVKSDNGMIAVVTNGLNKAYFLRENDPVFNGYVVKITGDSIVFKETLQDQLGKPFTKDVVKRITDTGCIDWRVLNRKRVDEDTGCARAGACGGEAKCESNCWVWFYRW